MSIVRYKNKKTGRIAVYESTSYYDPELKQSRPKRKYLGTEDPVTGELIPSSGKRGRKKKTEEKPVENSQDPMAKIQSECSRLRQECLEKNAALEQLKEENKHLRAMISDISGILDRGQL